MNIVVRTEDAGKVLLVQDNIVYKDDIFFIEKGIFDGYLYVIAKREKAEKEYKEMDELPEYIKEKIAKEVL